MNTSNQNQGLVCCSYKIYKEGITRSFLTLFRTKSSNYMVIIYIYMVISHHLRYSIYTIIYLFDDSKSQVLKNQGAAINTSVVYPSFHHRCCIFFVIEHDSSSIVPCRTPHFRSVSVTLGKLW